MKHFYLFLVLFALTLAFPSCSYTSTRHTSKSKSDRGAVTLERITPSSGAVTQGASPAGPMVERAVQSLANEESEKAQWQLEEAVRTDPNYAPAYYWLARTHLIEGDMQGARDLLDKAEALTGSDTNLLNRIDELRNAIR